MFTRCIALAVLSTASIPVAHAQGLADPMRPPAVSPGPGRSQIVEARVTAIFMSADRRVAVFDGRVVKKGDRVGDVVIEEILTDGVRYRRGGRSEVVRLPKQSIRVRRTDSEESEP